MYSRIVFVKSQPFYVNRILLLPFMQHLFNEIHVGINVMQLCIRKIL